MAISPDAVTDTIFALSSGAPPAGIGLIRISGPAAGLALTALTARTLPPPRQARLSHLCDPRSAEVLDHALTLWFPGPSTVTGEDLAELHCHGGRAVIAAVQDALGAMPGLRLAEPGEFTRRAFMNGRMDLNAVEGLADLLAAETQQQRAAALLMAEGHFSRHLEQWQRELLEVSAMAEAALDFSDEDDVPETGIEALIRSRLSTLAKQVQSILRSPSAERLREGIRVVLAGPPNAGKSTLLNTLVGRDAAIVSDIAGTTRDRIEVPAAIGGVPFLLTDTAGLRDASTDAVEMIGIGRAKAALEAADIILWLGAEGDIPRADAILVAAQADRLTERPGLEVSAVTGRGIAELIETLLGRARELLPAPGEYALHKRQRDGAGRLLEHVAAAQNATDGLVAAEELRLAREAIDRLTGRAGTEHMLDQLFSGFCIGK